MFLEKAPLVFGFGVAQDTCDEISVLEIIPNDQVMERDAALLQEAKPKIANFNLIYLQNATGFELKSQFRCQNMLET